MEQFNIQVIDQNIKTFQKRHYCIGQIAIGSSQETFWIDLDIWDLVDYQQQWIEGLTRLKTHDYSCLVASVPASTPWIHWWSLYKEENIVFIYDEYPEVTEKHNFTKQNCYTYLNKKRTHTLSDGTKIIGWQTSIDSIEQALIRMTK